jgi:transcriptional regulator with XRE-family HTH domain
MAKTKTPANDVGKKIQKRRKELGLTQEAFAARCQLHGFDISRGTISQIEARLRGVRDRELKLLAEILQVSTDSLFPGSKVGNTKGKYKVKATRK